MNRVDSPRGRALNATLLVAVIAVGIAVAATLPSRAGWSGWLPETFSKTQDLSLAIGLLAPAMLVAWMASPLRDGSTSDLIALGVRTRAETSVYLRRVILGAAGVVTVVPSVAVLALDAVLLRSAGTHAFGSAHVLLWGLWLAGTFAAAVALLTCAALIGRWLRSVIAVVLAPFVVFALLSVPLMTVDVPMFGAVLAEQQRSWLEAEPSAASAVARLVLWGGLALTTAYWLAGRARWARGGLLVASLGLTLGLIVGPSMVTNPEAVRTVCDPGSGGAPRVCTMGAFEAGLPRYAAAVREGAAALPDALIPTVIRAESLGPSSDPRVLAVPQPGGDENMSNVPVRKQVLLAMGESVFTHACTTESGFTEQLALQLWWLKTLGISPEDAHQPWEPPVVSLMDNAQRAALERRIAALDRMDSSVRETWFAAHEKEIRTCTLPPTALAR